MSPPGIRVATLVRAPRDRVYDALTRAEELDAWFTTGAEIDLRPGGEMVWRWPRSPSARSAGARR